MRYLVLDIMELFTSRLTVEIANATVDYRSSRQREPEKTLPFKTSSSSFLINAALLSSFKLCCHLASAERTTIVAVRL